MNTSIDNLGNEEFVSHDNCYGPYANVGIRCEGDLVPPEVEQLRELFLSLLLGEDYNFHVDSSPALELGDLKNSEKVAGHAKITANTGEDVEVEVRNAQTPDLIEFYY